MLGCSDAIVQAAAGSRILEPKGEDVDADLLRAEDGMVEIRLSPSPMRRGADDSDSPERLAAVKSHTAVAPGGAVS